MGNVQAKIICHCKLLPNVPRTCNSRPVRITARRPTRSPSFHLGHLSDTFKKVQRLRMSTVTTYRANSSHAYYDIVPHTVYLPAHRDISGPSTVSMHRLKSPASTGFEKN